MHNNGYPLTAAGITASLRDMGYAALPPGEIQLDESITMHGHCLLEGCGFATRLNCTGDFPAVVIHSDDERPVECTLRDFRITRSNTVGAESNQHLSDGIRLWGDGHSIDNVWIEDSYKGIHVVAADPVSTNLSMRRVRTSHRDPTVFNSHSGFYVDDVDGITIEQSQPGIGYYGHEITKGKRVTNMHGEIKMSVGVASATVHARFSGNDTSPKFPGSFTSPTVPRSITVAFEKTWDGGDVTVVGTDQFGNALSEVIADAPGKTVTGSKVFATVTSARKQRVGVSAAAVSLGTGVLGDARYPGDTRDRVPGDPGVLGDARYPGDTRDRVPGDPGYTGDARDIRGMPVDPADGPVRR